MMHHDKKFKGRFNLCTTGEWGGGHQKLNVTFFISSCIENNAFSN